jgi:hypothetical protein
MEEKPEMEVVLFQFFELGFDGQPVLFQHGRERKDGGIVELSTFNVLRTRKYDV